MSENSPATNTGLAPPVSGNNADFQDVDVGTGESVATAEAGPIATAEGNSVDSNTDSPLRPEEEDMEENASAVAPVPVPAAPSMNTGVSKGTFTSKKGKPLSQKQHEEQAFRATIWPDMQAKYAERFADRNVYKKQPKAKYTNVGRLVRIRRDEGEDAYTAELKKIMDRDDPMIAKNASLNTRKVKKPKKGTMSANMGMNSAMATTAANAPAPVPASAAANVSRNAGSKNMMVESIENMAKTAKEIIDTMAKTARSMAGELAKTNTAAMPQLSNTLLSASQNMGRNLGAATTVKAPRKRGSRTSTKKKANNKPYTPFVNNTNSSAGLAAPLPPLPEETSSDLLNANNGGR
jgi:hypothetical protein